MSGSPPLASGLMGFVSVHYASSAGNDAELPEFESISEIPRRTAEPSAPSPKLLGTRTASAAQWDALADASPHATFFHTREWAELWQGYSGGTLSPVARLAKFDDGVVALLPAVEKTLLDLPHVGRLSASLRTVISASTGTYGGWLSAATLTPAHHRVLWEHTRTLNVDLTQNPYDPAQAEALPWTREEFTQVVDLAPGYEQVRRTWSRGHVSAVNKGARAGLAVTRATTAGQWQDYIRIYGLSVRRWGEAAAFVYRDDLFEQLSRSTSGKVRLWVVEYEGAVIAGAICLYQGDKVMYWHGAFDADLQHLRAAPLLHAEIMRQAVEDGYRWYDFNPSGGNEGVLTFKDRFGTQLLPANSLESDAAVKRALARGRAAVAARRA